MLTEVTTAPGKCKSSPMRSTIVLLLLIASALLVRSQTNPPPRSASLRVGVYDHPPFAQKNVDGKWEGLSIDLWEAIAKRDNFDFEYLDVEPAHAISLAADEKVDILAAGLGVSAEREQVVDFSQPFLASPVAVAMMRNTAFPHILEFLDDVLAHGVLSILSILCIALVVFSLVLWLVERRENEAHFGGHPVRGFGSALWFAAVTLTTVGYGDKTPKTVTGRVIVFFWMFFGVLVIGIFTATLASSIAVARVQTSVSRASDLAKYRNGTLEGSVAQNIVTGVGVPARVYPTIEDGLKALNDGEINAFVDSEASLRYLINQNYPGQMVLDTIPSTHVPIAFVVRPNLPQLDSINIALIDEASSARWPQDVTRWLGPAAD